MLHIWRRHERSWCSKTSKKDHQCVPKTVKDKNGKLKKVHGRGGCPIYMEGTRQDGTVIKPRPLNTRNWGLASLKVLEEEAGLPAKKEEKPPTTLVEAANIYTISKKGKSADRHRKVKQECERVIAFHAALEPPIINVEDVTLPSLILYMDTWTDANTTKITRRENLMGFFRFCLRARYITFNPAVDLPTISNTTAQTDVLSHQELWDIFTTVPSLADEYGRRGQPIALQTRAFALVLRYSGLSIGDVTGLPKTDVQGNRIITNRKKSGEEVYVKVPDFVIDALNAAPHDSEKYFFWSGEGKIHSRTNKWNERIQKLFTLAGIRLEQVPWSARASRSKKPRPTATRTRSQADPRWFRHTMARDLLENRIVTMSELAEILANSEEICSKHYSKFDRRRQEKIDAKMEEFWKSDPLYDLLAGKESAGRDERSGQIQRNVDEWLDGMGEKGLIDAPLRNQLSNAIRDVLRHGNG